MKYINIRTIILNAAYISGSIIILIFVHNNYFYSHVFDDVAAWGTFYTVFGVLYAIIAGFLIIEALTKYNLLQEIMEEEINDLQDVRDLAIYFQCGSQVIDKIIYELKGYAMSVVNSEWETMKEGNKQLNADTTREMYEVFSAINEIELNSRKDEIALELFMKKMISITTLRTRRISLSTQKLPFTLKLLLYFMSFGLIFGLFLLGVYSLVVHIIMTVSLVLSVQLLNSIILDIDNPFNGIWKIEPTLFLEFANTLDKGARPCKQT